MKKYIIASSLLLVTSPVKLFTMEQDCQPPSQLSAKEVQRRSALILKTCDGVESIDDQKKLSKAIFTIEDTMTRAPKEFTFDKVKTAEINIYNRLVTLQGGSKKQVKNSVFGLLDDISEEEKEPEGVDITTRTSFKKWQEIQARFESNKEQESTSLVTLSEIIQQKMAKTSEVSALQQQLDKARQDEEELSKQRVRGTEELEMIKQAQGLLSLKKLKHQKKMNTQKEQLTQEIANVKKNISKLEKDLEELVVSEDVLSKQGEITKARQKLENLEIALSHLNKDLNTTKGTASLWRTALWKFGWDNYEEYPSQDDQ